MTASCTQVHQSPCPWVALGCWLLGRHLSCLEGTFYMLFDVSHSCCCIDSRLQTHGRRIFRSDVVKSSIWWLDPEVSTYVHIPARQASGFLTQFKLGLRIHTSPTFCAPAIPLSSSQSRERESGMWPHMSSCPVQPLLQLDGAANRPCSMRLVFQYDLMDDDEPQKMEQGPFVI